ncbi:DEAD/DEAH box helicase family protein [Granulicella mallensis]|uniref:Type I restriction enzyme R subunit n=1 Tax=Granulicella mallensis TaxID=940614 RepID=A0A7W7ZND5_9BACT|nr:DEAD/DEAH box helicase family protein [Granulicella mallensis]MBB5063150.1 type I restriction enzyme R subunit [Granulicella mallensis]
MSPVPPQAAQQPPSNFAFLRAEWPALHAEAAKAESLVYPDPRTACFYARRALESVLEWLFKHEPTLHSPYQTNLSALIHEPTFAALAGQPLHTKCVLINRTGNAAVHNSAAVSTQQSFDAVRELFHLTFWLARTYSRSTPPADALRFNGDLLPRANDIEARLQAAQTASVKLQREAQQKLLEISKQHEADLAAKEKSLAAQLLERDADLERMRAEIAELRAANAARPDTHDYNEAETRDAFIDLLLKEAGWNLDAPNTREYAVTGLPTPSGTGKIDYVLWGPDALPLALIEAKRTRRSPAEGQQQAKLYADALEARFGQRPLIFYTNGYDHFLWDDLRYPPRPVAGFYTQVELQLLIQRRTSRKSLSTVATDTAIAERYYQERAIRRIAEAFEARRLRKALLVMATGSGKTRTIIALSDVLMRANWSGRILFLADRRTLVRQAVKEFGRHLPSATTVNLVTDRGQVGHIYVSTYPTMMNLIDDAADKTKEDARQFGPGFFDLIVVDEAHRSIYQKYGAIFDYFDSLLVGLTATPRDEIDRNTYRLFQLEDGVPTDEYSLGQAIEDKFLVPYQVLNTPARIPTQGIRYEDLTPEQQAAWDELEWSEDGEIPESVEAPEVHQWFFNESTVDLVLAHLMEHGIKVADGDRLGKTILFAKNQRHAEFIAKRFDLNYPHLAGHFARVITHKVEFAQTLIDDFSQPDKMPHLAISVDMLDTGIDVPEVVNLAFFKSVRSKTKFWQMIGRGTRLRPNLLGPGQDKTQFTIFDYCKNFEYFGINPDAKDGATTSSLTSRLFSRRVQLLAEVDRQAENGVQISDSTIALRAAIVEMLRSQIAGMSLDTFEVRPHRRQVERYSNREAFTKIDVEQVSDLDPLARLPSSITDSDGPAKVFDHLILRMQLAMLRAEPAFIKMAEKVVSLATLLEAKSVIPMIAAELPLLQEIQTGDFWRNATLSSLETVRLHLRSLVKLIEAVTRPIVITDFPDELADHTPVPNLLPAASPGVDITRFRAKAQHFLAKYEQKPAIQHLKWNEPLTPADISELEAIFLTEGASPAELAAVKGEQPSLGLFVRSLVGLDRAAARQAFQNFLSGKTLTASQHQFVELIVDLLARRGYVDPAQLYDAPFTNAHPQGVAGLFSDPEVEQMVSILAAIRTNAEGTGASQLGR